MKTVLLRPLRRYSPVHGCSYRLPQSLTLRWYSLYDNLSRNDVDTRDKVYLGIIKTCGEIPVVCHSIARCLRVEINQNDTISSVKPSGSWCVIPSRRNATLVTTRRAKDDLWNICYAAYFSTTPELDNIIENNAAAEQIMELCGDLLLPNYTVQLRRKLDPDASRS